MYYIRTTYYDDTPAQQDEFDTLDDAQQAYAETVECRQEAGPSAFGDCDRITLGRIIKGKRQPITRTIFN